MYSCFKYTVYFALEWCVLEMEALVVCRVELRVKGMDIGGALRAASYRMKDLEIKLFSFFEDWRYQQGSCIRSILWNSTES